MKYMDAEFTKCRLHKVSMGLAQLCSCIHYLPICFKLFVVDLLHCIGERDTHVWISNGCHDVQLSDNL